jgi:amino acid transporter
LSDKERQAADAPMPGAKATGSPAPTVFVREATGLVKNVSFFDSIAMNMSNMSVGALLGVIGISGLVPMLGHDMTGVNLVWLSVIGFLVSVPQIAVYTIMSRRMPRTGGDYVWVSRTFGGPVGSVLSFMGYTAETTAYLALIVLSTVFAIGAVGLFFNSSSTTFLGLAVPSGGFGSSPTDQFIVGALIFAALIGVNIVKPKAGYRLVSILTIFGFFSLLLAIAALLNAGSSGVQSFMNTSYMAVNGSNTYTVISNGGSTGFNFGNTLYLLPLMAAFIYPWLNAAPAVASEIKGKSAVRWNVPISAVLVFVFVTSALATLYYVGGQAFINGAYSNPNLVFNYSFNFWTLAMGVSSSNIVAGLIGLGWILANLSVLAYGVIVISRYLLAQSFDRFLPSRISNVNPRFGSPVNAFVISLVVTVVLVGAAAFYYSGLGGLFGATIASMIYFAFVGLAAATWGIRKEKGITKLVLVLAGIGNVFVFGFLTYQYVTNAAQWSLNNLTVYFVVGTFILGAIVYAASRAYHKARGVDISLAYKEIPPE